jgi:uncharacterized protein with ParB-like and HNH nuclease domain
MEASPTQIIQYFNGYKQSVIPLFQRHYEWSKTNWDTLWQDVMDRYHEDKDTPKNNLIICQRSSAAK